MPKPKKYAQAGVNIAAGDAASHLAGKLAATTFAGRKGKIGKPVKLPGGFAGALDFGDFYIVTCDDGTGTKMAVAEAMNKFDTLGYDLAAMVVDDAVCLGAEVISVSNTLDCPKVDKKIVGELLKGLAKACREQNIVIPGGEIAEVGQTVTGLVWNATAIGIVEKKKIIDGSKIKPGDVVISLKENGLRSNGFSLARYILQKKFGKNCFHRKLAPGKDPGSGKKWGELLLTPSKIYHSAILDLVGRYKQKAKVKVKGIVHVTGGGIAGNLPRVFRNKKLGAYLPKLWRPAKWIQELIRLGNVSETESREVWNLGNGMLIIVNSKDVATTLKILKKNKISAKVAGEINLSGKITF